MPHNPERPLGLLDALKVSPSFENGSAMGSGPELPREAGDEEVVGHRVSVWFKVDEYAVLGVSFGGGHFRHSVFSLTDLGQSEVLRSDC